MSERNDQLLLKDILDSIQNIRKFTFGLTFDQYEADLKIRHAVERNFTIIGEAASKISQELRIKSPQTEWRKVIAFRNIIVHDYFGIDNSIVWEIIHFYLGNLERSISAVLDKTDGGNQV